ncbi:MAG: hypothetical protein GXP55_04975 [Deltaproteobacteria bacterium]|nr:hypothetical protein [Deltaproteobacteria bacterium]
MSETPHAKPALVALLGRVPWILWAALVPALIIGGSKLLNGSGTRVPVVGAGPIAALRAQDAPPESRLAIDTRAHEPSDQTAARVRDAISRWPDVVVLAFDPANLGRDPAQQVALLGQLAREAQNATAVPVIVGFGLDETDAARSEAARLLREGPCRRPERHICVELSAPDDPNAVRAAVRAGIADALALHRDWRASTQSH